MRIDEQFKIKSNDVHREKLRLKLRQPILLDHDKVYKLGVIGLQFKCPKFLSENPSATPILEVHCNLVKPTFYNHDEHPHDHLEHWLLYTVFVDKMRPDEYIVKTPIRVNYRPLRRTDKLSEIIIVVKDDSGQKIDVPEITVELHLVETLDKH